MKKVIIDSEDYLKPLENIDYELACRLRARFTSKHIESIEIMPQKPVKVVRTVEEEL